VQQHQASNRLKHVRLTVERVAPSVTAAAAAVQQHQGWMHGTATPRRHASRDSRLV